MNQSFQEPCNQLSSIDQVIAVMSGKGGVGLSFLGSLPIDPNLRRLSDNGAIEDYQGEEVDHMVSMVTESLEGGVQDAKR